MSANPVARLLNFTTFGLLVMMGGGVFFATPMLAWTQLNGAATWPGFVFSLLIAFIAGCAGYRLRSGIYAIFDRINKLLGVFSDRNWLIFILLLGVFVRVAWVLIFPASAASDGATYIGLAKKLVAGMPYESAGTRAYWPPGYPFFLMPWLSLPLPETLAIILSNLVLYCLAVVVVIRLAEYAGGPTVARLSTLLLALWPTYLANAGLPEKENLLVLLFPLMTFLWMRSHKATKRSWYFALATGLTLGCATLVQPSAQLYFTVFICYEIVNRAKLRTAVVRVILVLMGMIIVIAPWTMRNISVFNQVVPITTNGGDNFYRANNALATGAYTERGEIDLSGYGELDRNKEGFRLARQWIVNHPKDFLALIIAKETLFLGDDSTGVYNSLKRGGDAKPKTYLILKAISNATWYAFWLIMFSVLFTKRRILDDSPVSVVLALGFAYFFVLHSVFESASKYHGAAMPLIFILLSHLLANSRNQMETGAKSNSKVNVPTPIRAVSTSLAGGPA